MRLKAQLHKFHLNQNTIHSYRPGGIIEHSIYRHVSKGGIAYLPGQSSISSIYLSPVPHSNYGGENWFDLIGKDIIPSALQKIANNVDNKIARTILNTAAKYAPAATDFISNLVNKKKGHTKENFEHSNYTESNQNNTSYYRPITYNKKQAITHVPKKQLAIEHNAPNLPAIEYKGKGNTRAKQAYKKFLKEAKDSTKHKGGAIRYD
jgi:hypothetical protein